MAASNKAGVLPCSVSKLACRKLLTNLEKNVIECESAVLEILKLQVPSNAVLFNYFNSISFSLGNFFLFSALCRDCNANCSHNL